jgi:hypothetical protein
MKTMKLADAMGQALLGALPVGMIETEEGTRIEVKQPDCPEMYTNLAVTETGAKSYRMIGFLDTAEVPACYPPNTPFIASARVLIAESEHERALTWMGAENAAAARAQLSEECARTGWTSTGAAENGAELWTRAGWSRHLIHRGPMLAIVDQVVSNEGGK